jgi:LPS-assembly lipoprotein
MAMQRRSALSLLGAWGAVGALAAAASLGGCGFQLRRPAELQLKRVHLSGFDRYSGLADELRRQLRASPGVVLVDSPAEADVVLQSQADEQEQVAAASSAAGRVTEVTLRTRFTFVVTRTDGRPGLPASTLAQSRDMSYAETNALAKEQEAQLMFRAMHRDIASQVLRRMAALPAPGTPNAAAPAASAVR